LVLYITDAIPVKGPETFVYLRKIDEDYVMDLVTLHRRLGKEIKCFVSDPDAIRFIQRRKICFVLERHDPSPEDIIVFIHGGEFFLMSVSTSIDTLHRSPWVMG
jgi:acetyl esterase/lipase